MLIMASLFNWIWRLFVAAPLKEEPSNKREQARLYALLQRYIRDCDAASVAEIFNTGDHQVYMNISRSLDDHETTDRLRCVIKESMPWYEHYLEYSPIGSELYERDSAESEDLSVYSR